MKNYLLLITLLLNYFFPFQILAKNQASKSHRSFVPGEIIVKYKQTQGNESIQMNSYNRQLTNQFGLNKTEQLFGKSDAFRKNTVGLDRIFIVKTVSTVDITSLAKKISLLPYVEYAEPNYLSKADQKPNDSLFSQQTPLQVVQAESAWVAGKGDSSVIIAILDTGVDWDHPDLAKAIWKNTGEIPDNGIDDDGNGYIDDVRGWDFVEAITSVYQGEDGLIQDNDPMDFNGHGTHVAGIAAAVTNNITGISSLSWGCKIMPVRIGWHTPDGVGQSSLSTMAKGFVYAADNNANVINLSYGTPQSKLLYDVTNYAYKAGAVICNSAGNDNFPETNYLGGLPNALLVAATNNTDFKTSYSNYSEQVDISAPGGDNGQLFLSTIVYPSNFYQNQQYYGAAGTSMATPFVASLAGLIKSNFPSMSPAEILFRICGTADNIDSKNPQFAGKLGSGRINAHRALIENPIAQPKITIAKVEVDDAIGGNNNKKLEPGENANIIVTLQNDWGDALNLTASLATSQWGATITKSSSVYGFLHGITNIDSCTSSNASDVFTIAIDNDAIPTVVPFVLTLTAANGYNKELTFELPIAPTLLLVDDDEGFNAEIYAMKALNKLGVSYQYWNHKNDGTPSPSLLSNYNAVIWLCEWAFPSLDSLDRSAIAQYLDNGGNLFLSGQDIGWDLCDPNVPQGYSNEYILSDGASKTFYETYLKSNYVADDAEYNGLVGISGDSVGNGLNFTNFQPGRAAADQYQDVVDPVNGGTSVFTYGAGKYAGKTGAVRYGDTYRLVFFSFGGFESITDSNASVQVMERVLRYLDPQTFVVDKVSDTEEYTTPFPVTAIIAVQKPLLSVNLYWDNDGTFPFNKLIMSDDGNGKYSATIPAQPIPADIEYFVLAKTTGGFLPYTMNTFHVGIDNIPPTMTIESALANTLNRKGPYTLETTITDNYGLDTNEMHLYYSVNGGNVDSVKLRTSGADLYSASIIPANPFSIGDKISYYVAVADKAKAKNCVRYPESGMSDFFIGKEMIDDFEKPMDAWSLGYWNYTTRFKKSGTKSITDSPEGSYEASKTNFLFLNRIFDLSDSTLGKAQLSFYHKTFIHSSDTFFIEIRRVGEFLFKPLLKLNGISSVFTPMKQEVVRLDNYTGPGNEKLQFRFRLVADGADQSDGIYIDDIELAVGSLTEVIQNTGATIPKEYSLSQNYPNPFNPVTTIVFALPQKTNVEMKIYNLIGQEVSSLVKGEYEPGTYKVLFDASRLPSGVYFYSFRADEYSSVKKMLLLK